MEVTAIHEYFWHSNRLREVTVYAADRHLVLATDHYALVDITSYVGVLPWAQPSLAAPRQHLKAPRHSLGRGATERAVQMGLPGMWAKFIELPTLKVLRPTDMLIESGNGWLVRFLTDGERTLYTYQKSMLDLAGRTQRQLEGHSFELLERGALRVRDSNGKVLFITMGCHLDNERLRLVAPRTFESPFPSNPAALYEGMPLAY